jgi:serine/threonine protein kinase
MVNAERLPFHVYQPKLVTSRARSQVFQCGYTDSSLGNDTPCVVKVFSTRAQVAYEKEVAVYSAIDSNSLYVTPTKLWSGLWTTDQYTSFLAGKLPSIVRRQETQVSVIVLTYINNASPLSDTMDPSIRIQAVKVALRALRLLHENNIVHGDPSADNVLIRMEGNSASAIWIDFSASAINSSQEARSFEWQKATEYYSEFVR